ncbi:transcription and mRNA export factor ENY2 [Diachasma alloeum]|uniref:Enhancer of yellow 2 transcription factor n=2 Tax=Braconidae TaxID=7402 RepID=A0A9R1TWY0_9HYME|nr:PREDICTED: transcription and mRNA export factor ENY2 [Fopius arisanus]XP_015108614.1 transcription and mRNA export factor ENY2 [Diachasma alloeum]
MKAAPHQRLVMVGDRDGLKELLRRRLVECGWRDQVKIICKDLIKENGHDITYDILLATVTSTARSLVPDSVKKELLQKIKNQLLAQEEKLKM